MSTLQAANLKNVASASNNISLDASGNVGIGTASPVNRLNVAGGRALFGPNSEVYAVGLGFNQTRVAGGQVFYAGATDAVAPDLLFANSAGLERARITDAGLLQFNSGYGSVATAFGCRAWVNFNGTGTVAIRASGNVSSITDNNTGDYTLNFTSAMPDANYIVAGGAMDNNVAYFTVPWNISQATGSIRLQAGRAVGGQILDASIVHFAVFR